MFNLIVYKIQNFELFDVNFKIPVAWKDKCIETFGDFLQIWILYKLSYPKAY